MAVEIGDAVAASPSQQAAIAVASGKRLAAQTPAPTAPQGGSAFQTALDQAKAEAASDITAQVAPLQSQIGYQQALLPQEQAALSKEFSTIVPYAKDALADTTQFNDAANQSAQAIFQQAGTNLNTMQQNNAAQAQQMAQQIGGPVSTGTFTTALTPYQQAIQQGTAGAGLNALELGTVGNNEASTFYGQILPAMQAEQSNSIRLNIQDKIQALKDQITTIQGTKSKLIDAKLPGLLNAQLSHQLQVMQLNQKKLEDNRSWTALQKSLALQWGKLALARRQTADQEYQAGIKAKQTGRQLSIEDKRVTAQVNQWATQNGINQQRANAYVNHLIKSDQNAATRNTVNEQKNMTSMLTALTGGASSTKPVIMTHKKYLTPNDSLYHQIIAYNKSTPLKKKGSGPDVSGILGGKTAKVTAPKNVYWDPKANGGKGAFYTYVTTHDPASQYLHDAGLSGTPVVNPNDLYQVLTSQNPDISPAVIADAIRVKLGIPNWKPGDPYPPKVAAKPTTQKNTTRESGVVTNPTSTVPGGTSQHGYTVPTTLAQRLSKMSLSDLTTEAEKYGFKPSPRKVGRQALVDFIYHALASR